MDTPLQLSAVRYAGAHNTSQSFLDWITKPHLPSYTFPESSSADANSSSSSDTSGPDAATGHTQPQLQTLQSVLHTAKDLSAVLHRADIFSSVRTELVRAGDPLASAEAVDLLVRVREKGKWFLKTSTEVGNNEGSAVRILYSFSFSSLLSILEYGADALFSLHVHTVDNSTIPQHPRPRRNPHSQPVLWHDDKEVVQFDIFCASVECGFIDEVGGAGVWHAERL
jgi:hypothetical protein